MVTDDVPPSTAPSELAVKVAVMRPLYNAGLLLASVTLSEADAADPATVVEGCADIASFDAAPATMLKAEDVADVRPALVNTMV